MLDLKNDGLPDSNDVTNYRLGLLEQSVKELSNELKLNNERMEAKIDAFMNGFATIKDLERVENKLDEIQVKVNNHIESNSDYPIIRRVVFGAVGLILAQVVTAIIALVVLAKR